MTRRRLVVTLPSDEYRRLAVLAHDDERGIEQQAAFLLRRLLRVSPSATPSESSAAIGTAEYSAENDAQLVRR
jgi:hypothetical protein